MAGGCSRITCNLLEQATHLLENHIWVRGHIERRRRRRAGTARIDNPAPATACRGFFKQGGQGTQGPARHATDCAGRQADPGLSQVPACNFLAAGGLAQETPGDGADGRAHGTAEPSERAADLATHAAIVVGRLVCLRFLRGELFQPFDFRGFRGLGARRGRAGAGDWLAKEGKFRTGAGGNMPAGRAAGTALAAFHIRLFSAHLGSVFGVFWVLASVSPGGECSPESSVG